MGSGLGQALGPMLARFAPRGGNIMGNIDLEARMGRQCLEENRAGLVSDAAIWSFIELNIAIIATCLPTLRPIFSKVMPRLFGSSLGRSYGRSRNGAYVQAPSNRSLANSNKKSTLGRSESTGSLQEHESIEASRHDFNTSPPGDYHISVSITGGEKQRQFPKKAELRHFRKEDEVVRGGIQARTIFIQYVTNEKEKQEK